jgi:hypothetical protein
MAMAHTLRQDVQCTAGYRWIEARTWPSTIRLTEVQHASAHLWIDRAYYLATFSHETDDRVGRHSGSPSEVLKKFPFVVDIGRGRHRLSMSNIANIGPIQ